MLSLRWVALLQAAKANAGHVSGTESDSDSILTPDVLAHPTGHSFNIANSSNPPLSSIAERRSGSGAEDSDEDEPADSGWRTPDNRTKPRNSGEESVLKSGYLWKKGERRKTWKKRWFVLRPAHLAYYKTSAEYQLLRLLDLSDIHSCTPVNLKRHDNTFGLISPNRTFYFQATSPDEVREWVAAIEDARQSLLATSTQNSASTPIPIVRTTEQQQQKSQARSIPQSIPRGPGSLILSSSPGQLAVTSSDSEDGGGGASQTISPSIQMAHSAPSPTAVNFLLAPPAKASAMAASSSGTSASKIILNGYLMKCGSKRRNWRKRWFVLSGEKLLYSGSHMDTKPHRVFPFTEILDALEYELPARHHHHHLHHSAGLTSSTLPPMHGGASTDAEDGPAAHTFKIVTTKRNLLLCAPTEDDEIKWLGAIRALIARRSGSGVVPGKTPKASMGVASVAAAAAATGVPGAASSVAATGHATELSPSGASSSPQVPPPVAIKVKTRRLSASAGSAEGDGKP
ncbi:pleckstrin-like protein [Ephemerocybe angulata]|uniref:Pleckstrin-like protein n=1 Tax=Ephemerocybe angulata TaxID=980116 RepID=A0A8H6I8M3_9AGAR|nr:pleckstrin-like protein [Tulosesus angulatus]